MSLSKNDIQDLRSTIGQISWLVSIPEPNLSFENCVMSTSQTKATWHDLIRANKPLNSAKNQS